MGSFSIGYQELSQTLRPRTSPGQWSLATWRPFNFGNARYYLYRMAKRAKKYG